MIFASEWLERVRESNSESLLAEHQFRIAVPGETALAFESNLLRVEPRGVTTVNLGESAPRAWSLLYIPDLATTVENASTNLRYAIGAELSGLMSLALGRRIVIANDVHLKIPAANLQFFSPVSHVTDLGLQGPLPSDVAIRINRILDVVARLQREHLLPLGAALSAFHGAILLFDREPRAAYTLLITGIELLSRKYGTPPSNWSDWEESPSWDVLFDNSQLIDFSIIHDNQFSVHAL